MTIKIASLDHLVISAGDLAAAIALYTDVLGMEHVEFGDGLHAVHFGAQKFNLHDRSTDVSPKAQNVVPGSADFCLISETPVSQVIQHLKSCFVEIEEGPVTRSGAVGHLNRSIFAIRTATWSKCQTSSPEHDCLCMNDTVIHSCGRGDVWHAVAVLRHPTTVVPDLFRDPEISMIGRQLDAGTWPG
jgi:catechol 2,3-dioxygenase-like lactoylglutathione lyase family enzyme